MADTTKDLGFIVLFLIICLFVYLALGAKTLYYGLWVILISMTLSQWDKINQKIREVTNI